MFRFFRISTGIAVIALFVLGLITLSDVFIHGNQLFFYMLTVVTAAIFFAMGLAGIMICKNFTNIWHYVLKEEPHHLARTSVRKLLFVFGLMALATALFSLSLCIGLVERMQDGMALFG